MRIHVAPLSRAAEVLARRPIESAVSLLAPGQDAPDLPCARRLHLSFHDIAAPRAGLEAASATQIGQLIDFARSSGETAEILVHCWLGISRSPAAALAIGCAIAPDAAEDELTERLRVASPTCTPNPRLIGLADAHLGRDGRLVRAVEAMGRGRDCAQGEPFVLEV